MDKKQILEGNKLIAEFMGYKYFVHNNIAAKNSINQLGWSKSGIKNPKRYGEIGDTYLCRSHNQLRFYNSWDWLMPVVEKIESLGYEVEIGTNCSALKSEKFDAKPQSCGVFNLKKDKLKTTYELCFNFIYIYTEYNKKP